MEQYLIDTNVVSDYFSAPFNGDSIKFMDSVIDVIPQIPVITQIELLCWKTNINIETGVREFISDSIVFPTTDTVIQECVNIRKGK